MEVLILLGIGVVIWLLIRAKQPAHTAAEEPLPEPSGPAEPPRFVLHPGPEREVMTAVLRCLAENPEATTVSIADAIDDQLREKVGESLPLELRLNFAKYFAALYTHAAILMIPDFDDEPREGMADALAEVVVLAFEKRDGIPPKRKKLAQKAFAAIATRYLAIKAEKGSAAVQRKVKRLENVLASLRREGTYR